MNRVKGDKKNRIIDNSGLLQDTVQDRRVNEMITVIRKQ
jgi:hypothetical protein